MVAIKAFEGDFAAGFYLVYGYLKSNGRYVRLADFRIGVLDLRADKAIEKYFADAEGFFVNSCGDTLLHFYYFETCGLANLRKYLKYFIRSKIQRNINFHHG